MESNEDAPQVKLIGGLTGGEGGSIGGEKPKYFTKWGWKEYANFTYPGQIIDETNTESNSTFIKRIKGKYIAEKILVEKPRTKIAIYGDSFAAIGENSQSNRIIDCEGGTWIYFLANILDVECHSYGVSASGEGDISHYVHETLDRDEYGYVIIFHTDPTRPSRYCEEDHSFKNCKRLMNDLKDYNVLHMYWDEQHRFFDYSDDNGKEIFISNYHVTNPNNPPDFCHPTNPNIPFIPNPFDNRYGQRNAGSGHTSERGNLRLAVEISKIIDKYL